MRNQTYWTFILLILKWTLRESDSCGRGICKLTFIDETRLLAETRELKKGLSENEANRNSVKVDTLFVRSNSNLAEKICSLSREPNPYFKLATTISFYFKSSSVLVTFVYICFLVLERMQFCVSFVISSDDNGGIINLCHECVGKPCERIKIFDNLQEDYVICLCYDLPVGSSHVPHLLSGVELPEKTISDSDIMETILWHERGSF